MVQRQTNTYVESSPECYLRLCANVETHANDGFVKPTRHLILSVRYNNMSTVSKSLIVSVLHTEKAVQDRKNIKPTF
jgi:hypothetical protein